MLFWQLTSLVLCVLMVNYNLFYAIILMLLLQQQNRRFLISWECWIILLLYCGSWSSFITAHLKWPAIPIRIKPSFTSDSPNIAALPSLSICGSIYNYAIAVNSGIVSHFSGSLKLITSPVSWAMMYNTVFRVLRLSIDSDISPWNPQLHAFNKTGVIYRLLR